MSRRKKIMPRSNCRFCGQSISNSNLSRHEQRCAREQGREDELETTGLRELLDTPPALPEPTVEEAEDAIKVSGSLTIYVSVKNGSMTRLPDGGVRIDGDVDWNVMPEVSDED